MPKNHVSAVVRSLMRHKLYTMANLGGLMTAISACLIIFLYTSSELNYDRFHEHGEQVYRLTLEGYREGRVVYQRAKTYGFIAPELSAAFPEIKSACRLINLQGIMGNQIMRYGDAVFAEEKMYYTDASFFDVFSFRLIEGDPAEALTRPYTAVITKSAAKKYFGKTDPMRKMIELSGSRLFQITGVMADIPENSHLRFTFLLSFASIRTESYMLSWADFLTYLRLDPAQDPAAFMAKLDAFPVIQEHLGPQEISYKMGLQPLFSIHLHSHLTGEAEINGSAAITYGLIIVALLILVIAWINYINLSAVHTFERAKEIGMRKILGAGRRDLIVQFLAESGMLISAAVVLSLFATELLLPLVSGITGYRPDLYTLDRPDVWIGLILVFVSGNVLVSLYPAFMVSAFRPVRILKGLQTGGAGRWTYRKLLIIAQFIISVVLIVITVTVFKQISYMRSQELGINISRTIIIKAPGVENKDQTARMKTYRSVLEASAGIRSVTLSSNIPGRESTWGSGIRLLGTSEVDAVGAVFIGIDYDYIPAYDLKIIAGRGFSEAFPSDRGSVLLNETAARVLGFDRPEKIINEQVIAWRETAYRVVGVIKDHHMRSLQYDFKPTVYFLRPDGGNFISVKTASARTAEIIGFIEKQFRDLFPGNPFEYFFLNEYFGKQYRAEQNYGKIFMIFTVLAVFIACLGLFALSAYAAIRRTREISIRKILGASVTRILFILSKDFMLLVCIATIIALPPALYLSREWLSNYAYRMQLSWEVLIFPVLGVLVIAFITTGVQAMRTALRNPVHTLRQE